MLIAKWILKSRKKRGTSEVDPLNFPIREQGPETGLVHLSKYYSKTCMDENSGRAPSGVGKTSQQKRRPIWGALKNGGAVIFDGERVLRTPSGDAQFPV